MKPFNNLVELKLSPYLANIMLHGDGQAFNVALVVPDAAAIRAWAKHESVTLGDDRSADPRVRGLIGGEIDRLGAEFKGFGRPRDFVLLAQDFTTENGLLTPTLKLKRREVVARYGKMISDVYARQTVAA